MRKRQVLLLAAVLFMPLLVSGCLWARTPPPKIVKKPKTTQVTVYYTRMYSETEGELIAEQHDVPKTSNMPLMALRELIRGQVKTKDAYAIIPSSTQVRSFKVDKNGLATVDFSRGILEGRVISAGAETLGIASVVATLSEFPNIKEVRFQVEGKESGTIDGKSIDNWWGFGGIKKQPFKM